MMTYQILWATADSFMAHDIVIVPLMAQTSKIHWVIMMPKVSSRYKETDFEYFTTRNPNLQITFIYSNCRIRSPKILSFYNRIYSIYKKGNYDIVHLDIWNYNPWILPLIYRLPKKKNVLVLHQGSIHNGMPHKNICSLIRKLMMKRIKYFKLYSQSQASLFLNTFPKATVFQFYLPLLDFGKPTIERNLKGEIIFLSFGIINYAKNIDLLIDAACLLYERGIRNFKVSINGACKDWSWYQQHIKYPYIFDLDIRMIDNTEIPNLFNGSHYLVQPYRVVSQSGPMKIAFNYNLPVIVSDLPGFTDEVVEGVNGFCFKCGDVNSLADKMELLIKYHNERYESLLHKMKIYTQENYSPDVLVQQHTNMFNNILLKE